MYGDGDSDPLLLYTYDGAVEQVEAAVQMSGEGKPVGLRTEPDEEVKGERSVP